MKAPPHVRFLGRLSAAGVRYVLIGVTAFNHYAETPSAVYSTADCDVLLKPTQGNFVKAVKLLASARYAISAGGEPLVASDEFLLRRIFEHRATVTGNKEGSLSIDLVLDIGGDSFEQWWTARRTFKASGFSIYCGSLQQLLRSKERAARGKDKAFLKLYREQLRDTDGGYGRSGRRSSRNSGRM